MTYGDRIELGKIFEQADTRPEAETVKLVFKCLVPDHTVKFTTEEVRYYLDVVDGLRYWVDVEQKELKYKPTIEEVAAGINDLAVKVGDMGTICALAEKFSKDPDEILQWKYGKVFRILYVNKQNYQFSKRYNTVVEQMAKRKKGYK